MFDDVDDEIDLGFDDDLHGEAALAAAIIRRAFLDLISPNKPHEHLDAYEFLTIRLWEDDNMWGDILRKLLDKDDVLRIVEKYARLHYGSVKLAPSKS